MQRRLANVPSGYLRRDGDPLPGGGGRVRCGRDVLGLGRRMPAGSGSARRDAVQRRQCLLAGRFVQGRAVCGGNAGGLLGAGSLPKCRRLRSGDREVRCGAPEAQRDDVPRRHVSGGGLQAGGLGLGRGRGRLGCGRLFGRRSRQRRGLRLPNGGLRLALRRRHRARGALCGGDEASPQGAPAGFIPRGGLISLGGARCPAISSTPRRAP